jgi:SAM-dependent methyltransferase
MNDRETQQFPCALTSRNTHAKSLEILSSKTLGYLLDAPAGAGAFAARWRASGGTAASLERTHSGSKIPGFPDILADLNLRLPFRDSCFDAISCLDGIEHLENPFHLIREFHRVLKTPGYLILSTPNIQEIRSRIRYLFSGFYNKFKRPLNESQISNFNHINPMTYPELRYILHTSGFRIECFAVNRIKFQSLFYIPLVPFIKIYTYISLVLREKNKNQKETNREIVRDMANLKMLCGETLIILAKKG